MLRFRSLQRWCSRQASDCDRSCATLRISLNLVRSSIVQDRRLLPIDSSFVYLAVSEYISLSLCVFSGQVRVSSHVNQQEHVKQKEAAKPCQIGKICLFLAFKNATRYTLHFATLLKNFPGSLGGSTPPRPPPAKHLHSPLATPLTAQLRLRKISEISLSADTPVFRCDAFAKPLIGMPLASHIGCEIAGRKSLRKSAY